MAHLAVAALAVGRPALAQTSTPAVDVQTLRVEYLAPAGCGSRTMFVSELQARTRRVHVVDTTEQVASISVELSDGATGIAGRLRLREPDGAETLRSVAGKTC